MAKAKKFLALSYPTDGSKKPTESCIQAFIDADEEIAKLRVDADKKAAIASVMSKRTSSSATPRKWRP